MKRTGLAGESIQRLIERFTDIALAMDRANETFDVETYNSLYDPLQAIIAELKARDGDARRHLQQLYDYPNWQVRLAAANATLAVARAEAERVLQSIVDSRQSPQASDAASTLAYLHRGEYKPE